MFSCAVCNVPTKIGCSACNQIHYCSREHQKKHWKEHKSNCVPYTIEINEVYGRYLIASRDINPGDVVIKKKPLLIAPKTVCYPLCLGCHKRINPNEEYRCSKCMWPVCGKDCENKEAHIKECRIFTNSKYKPNFSLGFGKESAYSSIAPLRGLILKSEDPKGYKTLEDFQDHLEQNINTPVYRLLRQNLVPFFKDILKLQTTDDEILKICSIFDTNAFEVRDSKGFVNIRGLYPTASLMAHSCKPNTKHCYQDSDFMMTVTATVPIKKGEMITTTYTQTLWGTLMRRAHLKAAKKFDCTCERCKDPTEFGLYVGSIYCSKCGKLMVSVDPLDQNVVWKCEDCGHCVTGKQMVMGNEELRKEVKEIDRSCPKGFERFLEKYGKTLHPTNSHFLEVKYVLTQMYGNIAGFTLSELTDELLERKIKLCQELIEVADVLQPGFSRFRGCLLYYLQAALAVQAKRNYSKGLITKEATEETMAEALKLLEEAGKILVSEPDLKDMLKDKLENLNKTLEIE